MEIEEKQAYVAMIAARHLVGILADKFTEILLIPKPKPLLKLLLDVCINDLTVKTLWLFINHFLFNGFDKWARLFAHF